MKRYTTRDLWGLINRIRTLDQARIAEEFIVRHFPTKDPDGHLDDDEVDEFNQMIESCILSADEIRHPERYY